MSLDSLGQFDNSMGRIILKRNRAGTSTTHLLVSIFFLALGGFTREMFFFVQFEAGSEGEMIARLEACVLKCAPCDSLQITRQGSGEAERRELGEEAEARMNEVEPSVEATGAIQPKGDEGGDAGHTVRSMRSEAHNLKLPITTSAEAVTLVEVEEVARRRSRGWGETRESMRGEEPTRMAGGEDDRTARSRACVLKLAA